ncbi:MAG: glutamate synthase central domain-containing protein, partial [Rickettsiales bacterium]
MKSHEASMESPLLGDHIEAIRPVIPKDCSDTAALNAAMELLVHGGRSLPLAKTVLIPPSWSITPGIPDSHKALYNYCNCIMSPWDGPAAMAACDGKWALAGMDRNGLRPMRYTITANKLLLVGSETGMVPTHNTEVIECGHLGPGEMIGVEFESGTFYKDYAIKDKLADEYPYADWIQEVTVVDLPPATDTSHASRITEEAIRCQQIAAGQTQEDMELILAPMVKTGKEAVGSMGDDTPIALLAKNYRGLHQFFRQNFSQVTNPPIDSIREKNVMSLNTRIGNKENILAQGPEQTRLLLLKTPVLLNADMDALRNQYLGDTLYELDVTFEANGKPGTMRKAIAALLKEADKAFDEGRNDFVLTDEHRAPDRAAIPMILAVGALPMANAQLKFLQ